MTQTQQRASVRVPAPRGGSLPRLPLPESPPHWWLRRRAWVWWAGALLAAWVGPLLCQLLRVDWLLPPVLLGVTASLLRGTRFLLDRLVFGFALLFGAACAAGLLISVWPWHLEPVPVAGVAFSALIGIAALLRRRPRLPLRVRATDLVVPVSAAGAWFVLWWPRRGGLFSDRFAQAAEGGDRGAHFMLYDAIRGVGGYIFQHRAAAAGEVAPGYQVYPQGGHFVTALLQNFAGSTTHRPSAVFSMAQFLRYDTATVILLCAAMAWAVVRIAGPALSLRVALPVAALAGGLLVLGDLETIIKSGFWAEQVCLGLLVILFALLVRPLPRTGEQLAVVAALLVAIAYTYYFALPVAAGATLVWLVSHRRRIRRRWLLALGTALLAVTVGAVPVLVNLLWVAANQGTGAALDATGALDPVGGGIPLALAAVVLVGLLVGRRKLTPVTIGVYGVLGCTAGYLVAVGWYQVQTVGRTDYYYEKALHILFVALIVMLGLALRRLAPALARRAGPVVERTAAGRRRIRLAPVVTAVLLAAAAVEVFNPIPPPVPTAHPLGSPSRGRQYLTGHLVYRNAGAVLDIVSHVPDPQGRATIVMPSSGGDPQLTSWVAVLDRDYPRIQDWRWWADSGRPQPAQLVGYLLAHPQPYQIITTDQAQLAALRQMVHDHPDADVQIVEYDPSVTYRTSW